MSHPYNTCRSLLRSMREDRAMGSKLMHEYWAREFQKHWPYRDINRGMGREQWAQRQRRYAAEEQALNR